MVKELNKVGYTGQCPHTSTKKGKRTADAKLQMKSYAHNFQTSAIRLSSATKKPMDTVRFSAIEAMEWNNAGASLMHCNDDLSGAESALRNSLKTAERILRAAESRPHHETSQQADLSVTAQPIAAKCLQVPGSTCFIYSYAFKIQEIVTELQLEKTSAFTIFNLALIRQVEGLSQGDASLLRAADQLYELALQIAFPEIEDATCFWLTLVALNNRGAVLSALEEETAAQQVYGDLLALLPTAHVFRTEWMGGGASTVLDSMMTSAMEVLFGVEAKDLAAAAA